MKLRIKYKIWIEDSHGNYILGPGGYTLLMEVKRTGSLRKAAQNLDMSYDYAWRLVKEIEETVGQRIIESHRGGRYGGGSKITHLGIELMKLYEKTKEKIDEALD